MYMLVLIFVMEGWSYVSENKGFVSADSVVRDKSSLLGWESKTSSGSSFVGTIVEGIENRGFEELGLPETFRKDWDVSSSITVGNCNTGVVANNRLYTSVTPSSVGVYSGNKPISRPLSSAMVGYSKPNLTLIDLKLGRFSDHTDHLNFRSSKIYHIGFSEGSSSTPAKRGRVSLSCQGAFCQVHGCKKDLGSSKDYHKRHKVCEIHSKTTKVIVNGVEQRFCQQCSRFHLLGEFDDVKRSCRKRLAGHNERRRKPQAGRAGRRFHSYIGSTGSRLQDNTLPTLSTICQDPMGITHPFKQEEGGVCCPPRSEVTIANRYHNPESLFSQSPDKITNLFHVNKANNLSSEELNISQPTNQNTLENVVGFESASSALSLLSSQSRNSSSVLSGTLVPQSSISVLSNNFTSPTDLFSLIEENISLNNSIIYGGGMFQGSSNINTSKSDICGENVRAVDLIQLSSQLLRVEHDRQCIKLNQDSEAFCSQKFS